MTEIPPAPILAHEEGTFQALLRKHGPWVLILTVLGLAAVVAGTIRQDGDMTAKERDSMVLEECLDILHQNPSVARQKIEAHLPLMQDSPLRPWLEFLALRTHAIEAQRDWVAQKKDPSGVVAMLDTFIQGHIQHPEVTAFAWLNKATLLEDVGQFEKSAEAYSQLAQFPNSVATHMSGTFSSSRGRSDREKLWKSHLETIKP